MKMIQVKGFRDCGECGAKCCKLFGIPADRGYDIFTTGVPLDLYRPCLESDATRYFQLHEGITVKGDRFFVGQGIRTEERDTRLGRYIVVYSKCTKLIDGRCGIYKDRPEICKNFVASTARFYFVPLGCIFDYGSLGEDLGIQ